MPLRALIIRLLDFEIWFAAAAVGASLLAPRLLPVAVVVPLLFWPLRRWAAGRWSARTPADWAVGLLVLLLPVTLWATALPEITRPQVQRLLSGILLFYALVNWAATAARLRWLVGAFFLAGIALAGLATISVEWATLKLPFIPAGLYSRFAVLVSDAIHPNVLAGSLVLLFPLPAAYWLFYGLGARRSAAAPGQPAPRLVALERVLAAAALISLAGLLFLTQSRGAWLAAGLAGMLLIALRWRWGWLVFPLALVVIVSGFLYIGPAQVLDALSTTGSVETLDGRLEIWSRAVYMIQDFPFTGIGMGSFLPLADALYPFFLYEPGRIEHAHNLLLQVAVDLGLPGLIAWLAVLLLAAFAAWRVLGAGRLRQDPWLTALGAGLLAAQLTLLAHGMFDSVTWGMVRPAPLVWALWGLAFAAQRVTSARGPAAKPGAPEDVLARAGE